MWAPSRERKTSGALLGASPRQQRRKAGECRGREPGQRPQGPPEKKRAESTVTKRGGDREDEAREEGSEKVIEGRNLEAQPPDRSVKESKVNVSVRSGLEVGMKTDVTKYPKHEM